MTAIVITASGDTSFIRPLAALKKRGISTVVVALDASAFEPSGDESELDQQRQRSRALRHALAEYQITTVVLDPHRPLAEAFA
jgi:uncharacterized LabA/DUF88 family protein